MAKIIDVAVESMPAVKFIGKKYTNSDRDQFGLFAEKWEEWFKNGYFNKLSGGGIEKISDDYIGLMRFTDQFEYWIGILMSPNDEVPEGYQSIMLPPSKLGVCYVYGSEINGDIYCEQVYEDCIKEYKSRGWKVLKESIWLERYNFERFTKPDEKGNVVLDYCIVLKD